MQALAVAKKRVFQEKLLTFAAIGAAFDQVEKAKTLFDLEAALSNLGARAWGLSVKYRWFAMYERGRWRVIQAPVEIEGGENVAGPFDRREDARNWIRAKRQLTVAASATQS